MNLFNKKKIVVPVIPAEGQDIKVRCSSCGRLIDYDALKKNLKVCPHCGYHFRMSAAERIALLTDKGSFKEIGSPIYSVDSLKFHDTMSYAERLKKLRDTLGLPNAVITGTGKVDGALTAIGVFAFEFISGTLGSATGEKLAELFEFAGKNNLPVVAVFSSAGERIQEGIYSLMQIAKVVQAVEEYKKNGGLFISVITNPVLGGAAVIASGGDIIIAEKGSYVGVSGPRVSEQVMRHLLPKESQKAETLLKKGFIDTVVTRFQLKDTISHMLKFYRRWSL
jgi:acetyl-CoA carboxylase carboxyl transferase subunit beta